MMSGSNFLGMMLNYPGDGSGNSKSFFLPGKGNEKSHVPFIGFFSNNKYHALTSCAGSLFCEVPVIMRMTAQGASCEYIKVYNMVYI